MKSVYKGRFSCINTCKRKYEAFVLQIFSDVVDDGPVFIVYQWRLHFNDLYVLIFFFLKLNHQSKQTDLFIIMPFQPIWFFCFDLPTLTHSHSFLAHIKLSHSGLTQLPSFKMYYYYCQGRNLKKIRIKYLIIFLIVSSGNINCW